MTESAASHDRVAGLPVLPGDLYEVLQISPHASQNVILAAYRTLARTYHPDVNSSAEAAERIRQLNAAYRVLSDPRNRAGYDLERARTRRNERTSRPDQHASTVSSALRYSRSPQLRAPRARRPFEGRPPMLNAQLVLGFLAMALLTVVLFIFFWATFDPAADYNPAYRDPTIDVVRH